MDELAALRAAIDLVQVPSRVRHARADPLPGGVELLLRVAAGEPDALRMAGESTSREPAFLRTAAAFFIEQVLLAPGADSYRVLGASPTATSTDLRRNMALLLRWLHPDIEPTGERSVLASRVTSAWEDLKTTTRRATYDGSLTEAVRADAPGHPRDNRLGGRSRGIAQAADLRNGKQSLRRIVRKLLLRDN